MARGFEEEGRVVLVTYGLSYIGSHIVACLASDERIKRVIVILICTPLYYYYQQS